MGMASSAPAGVPARVVALAALGYAGGVMGITLVFLGMRAVMDIGGMCADGGPYVSAQSCPAAAEAALPLGIVAIILFGLLAQVNGVRIGGIWSAAGLLGWAALFGLLGWNFMEYGVFAPPVGGIEWGWAICGIVFWAMAAAPLLALLPAGAGLRTVPADAMAGRAARKAAAVPLPPDAEAPSIIRIVGPDGVRVLRADDPEARAQLAAVDAALAAALGTPEGPGEASAADGVAERQDAGPASTAPGVPTAATFEEDTQALLDRLERLGDMRDRGLLEPAEYETAKDAVVRELEARA